MSAVFEETQLDLFGNIIGKVTAAKKVVANISVTSQPVTKLAATQESDILFDATGWYGTPDTIKKLNSQLAKLKAGQSWINGHGVTVTYLGLTQTGEKLHQDVAGVHVYVKPKPQSIPQKKYPIKGEDNTPRFTLEARS